MWQYTVWQHIHPLSVLTTSPSPPLASQTFISTSNGVSVTVTVGFLSSSFGYGETSMPMENMLSLMAAIMSAQVIRERGGRSGEWWWERANYLGWGGHGGGMLGGGRGGEGRESVYPPNLAP